MHWASAALPFDDANAHIVLLGAIRGVETLVHKAKRMPDLMPACVETAKKSSASASERNKP